MNMIRILFLRIRAISNSLKNNYLIYKFKKSILPISKKTDHIGHVLIVQNLSYVKISIHSILSFLFYNKNSKVIVHCDVICCQKIIELYSAEIFLGRVEVKQDISDSCWQLSKLKIFKNLPGGNHCMFDVDTRWNGELKLEPNSSYVSHFEFPFIEQSPWRWIISDYLKINDYEKFMMFNTSFIRKSNCLNDDDTFLDDLFENLTSISDRSEIGKADIPRVIRLAEQVAISIYFQCKDFEVKAIVDDGSPKSGMLFETTYFGATGNRF